MSEVKGDGRPETAKHASVTTEAFPKLLREAAGTRLIKNIPG